MGFDASDINKGVDALNKKLDSLDSYIRKVGNQSPGLDRMQREAVKTAGTIDYLRRSLSGLSGVLGPMSEAFTVGVTIPLGLVGRAAFQAFRELNGVQRGLESLLGNSSAASRTIEELRDLARAPGLDFTSTTQGYRRLIAAGLDTNLATNALKEFGNALALVGGNSEDLAGVTLAIQQIASKTKVSAEEVNQIAERIPSIRRLIVQAFGTADTEELQKRGIVPKDFIRRIVEEAERTLPRAAESLATQLKNARDEVFQVLADLGSDIGRVLLPYVQSATVTIKEMGAAFRSLDPETRALIVKLGLLAVAIGPVLYVLNLIRGAAEALNKTYVFFSGLLPTLTTKHAAEAVALNAKAAAYDRVAVSASRAAVAEVGGDVFSGIPVASGRTAGQARELDAARDILDAKRSALARVQARKAMQGRFTGFLEGIGDTGAAAVGAEAIRRLGSMASKEEQRISRFETFLRVMQIRLGGVTSGVAEAAKGTGTFGRAIGGATIAAVSFLALPLQAALQGIGRGFLYTFGGVQEGAGALKTLKGMMMFVSDVARDGAKSVANFFAPMTEFFKSGFAGTAKQFRRTIEDIADAIDQMMQRTGVAQFFAQFRRLYESQSILPDVAANARARLTQSMGDSAAQGLRGYRLDARGNLITPQRVDSEKKAEEDKKLAESIASERSNLMKEMRRASADLAFESEDQFRFAAEYARILSDREAERADKAKDLGAAFTKQNQAIFDQTTLLLLAVARQKDLNKLVEDGKKLYAEVTAERWKAETDLLEARSRSDAAALAEAQAIIEKTAEARRKAAFDQAEIERDILLSAVDSEAAYTVEQKQAVEMRKLQIEVEYLGKVRDLRIAEIEEDRDRQIRKYQQQLDAKLISTFAWLRAVRALEAQSDQEIADLRKKTDAEIQKVTADAQGKTAQIARDEALKTFQSVKDGAGRVFDALLLKTESFGQAVKNILKTALLTPIREFAANWTATMLTGVTTQGARAAGGTGGTTQGLFNRIFGGFGGGGGFGGFGSAQAPGGTPTFTGAPAFGGGSAGSGAGAFAGFAGMKDSGLGLLRSLGSMGSASRLDINGNVVAGKGVGGAGGGAMLLGGGILAVDGLRRGGFLGLAETTAGGALIGAKFGGPIGAAIGAGIGAAAGTIRLFIKGAEEKIVQKVKSAYGITIPRSLAKDPLMGIIRSQQFGGNTDMAIRSQQVRELIELYAMSTGQGTGGLAMNRMQPISFAQSSGQLLMQSTFTNGMAMSPAPPAVAPITVQLDAGATTAFLQGQAVETIQQQPRIVQGAVISANRSNAGRRDLLSLQMQPGALTA